MTENNSEEYLIENLHTCNNRDIHSKTLGKPIIFSDYCYHICAYLDGIIYKHKNNKQFYTYADILNLYVSTLYIFPSNTQLLLDFEAIVKNSNKDDKFVMIDNKKYDFITIENEKYIIIDMDELEQNITDIEDTYSCLNQELNGFIYDKKNLLLSFRTST